MFSFRNSPGAFPRFPQLGVLVDALRARSRGFIGAASLPRHLRRRATSHNPRDRRQKRPNAKRAKVLADAGFGECQKNENETVSRYKFSFSVKNVAMHWCRAATRRPERARVANRKKLVLGSDDGKFGDENADTKRKGETGDDASDQETGCQSVGHVCGAFSETKNETQKHWRRLETHVWHAKRFEMTHKHGWALPKGVPGKGHGARSLVKRSLSKTIAHDASYHASFVLSVLGSNPAGGDAFDTLRSFIAACCGVSPNEKSLLTAHLRSRAFARGETALDGTLFAANGALIAPVEFIRCFPYESERATVFCSVHAAARHETFTVLKELAATASCCVGVGGGARSVCGESAISVRRACGRVCRLELVGKNTEKLVRTLVGSQHVLDEHDGGVTPRRVFKSKFVVTTCTAATGEYSAVTPGTGIRDGLQKDSTKTRCVLARVAEDVLAAEEASPGLRTDAEAAESSCPLMIVRRARPVVGAPRPGFTVFAPAAVTKLLWQKIVYANVAVAGQREWRWLASVSGAPCFPEDYPESKSAGELMTRQVDKLKACAACVPKGKRAADGKEEARLRAGVGFVLSACMTKQSDDEKKSKKKLTRVLIACPKGGSPVSGAAILAPTHEQIESIRPKQKSSSAVGERRMGTQTNCAYSSFAKDDGKLNPKSASPFDEVFGFGEKTKNRKTRTELAIGSANQTVLGVVTSATPKSLARGTARAVMDLSSAYLAKALVAWQQGGHGKKGGMGKQSRGTGKQPRRTRLVLPIALTVPHSDPPAIVPATLTVLNAETDFVWW